ncbi:MAG: dihydroxy-acid dehydratase [Rikenellaceae bacterium]|nr:dihydroxy-acid dehydratase [Rikenellaceae bacterium]
MIQLRSNQTRKGRRMAGARALWRANGMTDAQMDKPVIAIVNSFTQFVPGHVHLHGAGQLIKKEIEKQGMFAAEFNTIAIDDGIAMGHSGMLYSLPSRELIADSIEYMCNAHKADAMICISNCDKITPGMIMAIVRLNIPSILVSGGAMEAGRISGQDYDLVDIMVKGGDKNSSDSELETLEKVGCPTCGSCSGMFTANSINCIAEALGLALPGNGTLLATHVQRRKLFLKAAKTICKLTLDYYDNGNVSVLPRSLVTRESMLNSMSMDIAMGGSTNTVLHMLAIAHEAGVRFSMDDIDNLSKKIPVLCKVSPNGSHHIQDLHRAGGVMRIMEELDKGGLINTKLARVDNSTLKKTLRKYSITGSNTNKVADTLYRAAPGNKRSSQMGSQDNYFEKLDTDGANGCVRDLEHAYSPDGGVAVLKGNIAPNGAIVKTAGVPPHMQLFSGRAIVFESQEEACDGILEGRVKPGSVVVIRYEGPRGGPGMQEMLYPTSYLKSAALQDKCALITDGRFSGGSSGLSIGHISPEAAAGGLIALINDGDEIIIDIPSRTINAVLSECKIVERRVSKESQDSGQECYVPAYRHREIPNSLKIYSAHVSSADKGAVRII